jgi:hypothetical protein
MHVSVRVWWSVSGGDCGRNNNYNNIITVQAVYSFPITDAFLEILRISKVSMQTYEMV